METTWKYCLLFCLALVGCSHGEDTKAICENVNDQMSLSCLSISPGQVSSVINVTELCLCYIGCTPCFCMKADWGICERLQSCTISLSEDAISKLRSILPTSGAVGLLLLPNIYAKIVYTCVEVGSSTTTLTTTPVSLGSMVTTLFHRTLRSTTVNDQPSEVERTTTSTITSSASVREDHSIVTTTSYQEVLPVSYVTFNVLPVAVGGVIAVNVTVALIIFTVIIIRKRKRAQSEAVVNGGIVMSTAQPVVAGCENQLYECETKSVTPDKTNDVE